MAEVPPLSNQPASQVVGLLVGDECCEPVNTDGADLRVKPAKTLVLRTAVG